MTLKTNDAKKSNDAKNLLCITEIKLHFKIYSNRKVI